MKECLFVGSIAWKYNRSGAWKWPDIKFETCVNA